VRSGGIRAVAKMGVGRKTTMRNGQNKRMRGRNRKGGHHHQNPLSRMYESNGPDVKIRGSASHVAEKYLQLARDAQSSGDPIAAENYYQHAEHYFRLIAAAQEQFRQSQPYFQQQQQQGDMRGNVGDDAFDDDDEQPHLSGEPFAPREPQQFYGREPQQQPHHQPQQQQQPPQQQQNYQPRPQHTPPPPASDQDVDRLPSFITGGQPQQAQPQQNQPQGDSNGYNGGGDRFPLHRRRRRHRGPRDHGMPGEGDAPSGSRPVED
jgi:uncharacterized protein DUF4167